MCYKMSEQNCRLCGKDNGLTNVFGENDLCLKISTCFGIKIHRDDPISKNICKSCYFSINCFYEFRINAVAYDIKLQKEYKAAHPGATFLISYPSEISQDAFLNTLNLTNKNDVSTSKPRFHPTVLNLKRKYPNINIPKAWHTINIDPEVILESSAKVLKRNDLGIWSVKNKHLRSKQTDLILTRIRSNNMNKNISKDQHSYTMKGTLDEESVESKKKKKKNVQWARKKKTPKKGPTKPPVKVTKEESPNGKITPIKLSPESLAPGSLRTLSVEPQRKYTDETANDSDTSTDDLNESIREKYQKTILQRLLQTDSDSLSEVPSRSEDNNKTEEYGNLLISMGEEVQTFICQTCNQIFDTLIALNNHKKFNHKSSLRCTKCSKRFSIVESLVQHNNTYHPEINELKPSSSSPTLSESKETKSLFNTTARKRTHGGFVPMFKTNEAMDISTISSDSDDNSVQEITSVSLNDNNLSDFKANSSKGNVNQVTASLENKTKDKNVIDLSCDDVLYIDSDDDCAETETNNSNTCTSSTSTSNNTKNMTSKEPDECFLITDESNSSSTKSADHENTSENNPTSTVEIENNNTGSSVCQKIVVVPSDEDKEHMEAASSIKAKITNELSYINYIFNKCSFSERPKNEKKWYLRDIHKFTEKTYLPIEVVKSSNKELSVEYTPAIPEAPRERLAFWDTANAIDTPISRLGLDKPFLSVRARESAKKYFAKNPQSQKLKNLPPENRTPPKPTELISTTNVTPTSVFSTNTVSNTQNNLDGNIPTTSGSIDKTKQDQTCLANNTRAENNIQVLPLGVSTAKAFNILQIPSTAVAPLNRTVVGTKHGPIVLNPNMNSLSGNPVLKTYTKATPSNISNDPLAPNCKVNQKEQSVQLHNGFILMGLKTDSNGILKPTGDSAYLISEVDKTNTISLPKQPIIINGLSYPTVAKMKTTSQPTLVLQQTNSTNQNCVNVIQQDNEQNHSVPTLQQQNTCAVSAVKNTLDSTSDSTVTSTKPMIRIKNLSELQDGTNNAHQRQQLHTTYTTALSNYVQNHSSTLISEPTNDEYWQIS